MANDTLKYDVSNSLNQTSGSLSVGIFKNQLPLMQQWNHYGFFYANKTITMTLNGIVKGTQAVNQSTLNSSCQTCTIGNSLNLNESINVYLRHFLFSKIAWTSSLNLTNLMHHITQPTDSNVLAYFIFQSTFNNEETYYHNSSRAFSSNGLSIQQSSEPEFVCYCTGTYPNYLKMGSDFILAPINLMNISNNRLDNSGLIIDFQIYPQQSSNSSGDQVLFSIYNYTDIVLTNQSSSIRVDLYNLTNSTIQSIYLSSYRFRFNYWTSYTINITKTNVTLSIDGSQVQSLSHKTTFRNFTNLTNASTLPFTIQQPLTITYLLNNVTLKNSKGVLIVNNTYSQNSLTPSNYSVMIQSGTIKFGTSNKLCSAAQSSLTNYWTGSNCADRRLSPQFNNRSQNSSSVVTGMLNSSLSDYTISLWVRDLGNKSQGFQVIFENSLDNTSPLLQLSITNGNTTSSGRNISCTPYAYDKTKPSLTITTAYSYNAWNHLSCSSDSVNTQIKSVYYNSQNMNYSTSIISGYTFQNAPLGIITSIGSSFNGGNKFSGFIREIKIWKNAKSEYELNMHRFQSVDTSSGSTKSSLIYYFRLGDQINPNTLQDSYNSGSQLLEQSLQTTSIDYSIDKDLVICQPGYYFNGQCCSIFDISSASFTLAYSTSQNYFLVSLDSTSINSFLYTSMKANFSVVSVGNNYQTTYLSGSMTYLQYLNTMFTANAVQTFNVSSFSVSPKAYNITIQAVIYSDLYPSNSVTVNQTITLTCPMIWLNILPNYVTDSPQIVSMSSQDYQPVIYAQVQSQCYNPLNGSLYQANVGAIKWSTVGSSYTINNTFTTSSDGYSISSVKNTTFLNGTTLKVQANMTLGTKQYIANTITLYYAPIQINNNNASLYQTFQILYTQPLTIDLSFAQSPLTSSNSGLTYQVQCPQTMFSNTQLYSQLCVMNSTTSSLFTLNTSQVSAVSNYNYTFTFQIILQNTSILENVQATVQFYKDGSALSSCPAVQIQSLYNYSLASSDPLQLMPDPYLSCNGLFYTIQSANWTVTDSLTGNNLTQILVYGNQTVYRFANITSTSIGSLIPAGSLLNIQVVFNLYQNISQSLPSIVSTTAYSQVQFGQSPLVPKIQVYGKNKTLLVNNSVSYIEETMVLNASASYDPDNSSANIIYSWTCPNEVLQYYTCSSLQRGSSSQYLYLNALQRAKIGFLFNTSYTFGVTVSSLSNSYKASVNTTVQVTFNPPTKQDSKNNYDMAPQCESMGAQLNNMSVYYMNASYQRVVRFDILNYSNAAFNLSFTNANSCKNGNVSEQIMMFYEYDNGFFQSGQPLKIIYEQNSSTSILNSSVTLEDLSQYQISTINASQIYQTNIYWFTQRANSLDNIYLNIETVYYIRNRANMVVIVAAPNQAIDKYDNLILDASQSYDPEPVQSTYTFKWTCPGNMTACSSQNTSILNLTSKDRAAGLSNTNGTIYQYSVVMQDLSRSRVSAPSAMSVNITMKNNYSYCITTQIDSDLLDNYWQNTNQTIYFQYNQSQSINVKMNVSTSCPFINVETSAYSTSGNTVLWTTDNTASNSININSSLVMKYQKPEAITIITFKQRFSLGADISTKYYSQNYVNVIIISPTIVPFLKAPQISYFNNSTPNQTIVFNYTNSNDTISTWTFPTQFGGYVMSNSSLILTQTYLNTLNITQNYYNQPLQFTLTINSTTDSRTTTKTKFLYLADPTSNLSVSGIDSCYILNMNISLNSSQVSFNTTTVFQFSCASTKLTSSLLTNQSVLWSIDNLEANADYYQIGQYLYLKPYRASLLNSNELFVGVLIYTLGMTNPIKTSFKIITPELQSGSVISSPSDQGTAYSEIYSLTFSSFYAQYEIYFQMRGFYDIYQQYQIIFPIQPYLPIYQTTYYQNMLLPMVSQLYMDFFDANSNYIGSYNILTNTFPGLSLGSFNQADFQSFLGQISQGSNYTNTSQSLAQFEIDLFNIKCLSEALYYGIVQMYDVSQIQAYQIQIISYLTNNFKSQIQSYSSINEKTQIEIKTIYTLSNVLTTSNTQLMVYMNQTLQILEQVTNDYSIITADGDTSEIFRQTVISIFQTLDYQVSNANISSNGYQTRLTAMKTKIIGKDLVGLAKGQSKKTLTGTTSKQVLLLQTDSTVVNQTASMISQINSNESVYLDQEYLLSTLGASSLEVSFSVGSNDSSPAGTVLYINAYDSSYTKLSLDFSTLISNTTQSEYSIQYSLQAKADSQVLFASDINGYTYTPQCVYYDETSDSWSTYGVTTSSYSTDTGMLTCTTSHLSKFSMDYTVQLTNYPYTPDNPNNNSSDSSSSQNPPPTNISGNQTIPSNPQNITTEFFFQHYINAYGAIVGVFSFIVIADILISFITKTQWHNDCDVITKPWTQYSTGQIFKASMALYHILLASRYRPKKANIYLTMYGPNKVVMKWIFFFTIALIVEVVLMKSVSIEWTIGQQIGLAAIIMVCVHVFRIVYTTIIYYIYFNGQRIPSPNSQTFDDISQVKSRNMEYEGGSSEEEKDDEEEEDKYNKFHHSNKQQTYFSPDAKRDTISDVHIDSIEMEIEQTNQNGFFDQGWQKKSESNKKSNSKGLPQIPHMEIGMQSDTSYSHNDLIIVSDLNKKSGGKPSYSRNEDLNGNEKMDTTEKNMSDVGSAVKVKNKLFNTQSNMNELDSVRRDLNMHNEGPSPQNSATAKNELLPENAKKAQPQQQSEPVKKGPWILAFFINLAVLLLIMALAFYYMWLLTDTDHFHHWLGIIIGSFFFLALVIDPIFIFIFSMIFSSKGQHSSATKICGALLVGNGHKNLIYGVLYQLSQ